MTPQLQQAIKLLQLSTLDLKQEIQEALDSNLMLETEEEGSRREEDASDKGGSDEQPNGASSEQSLNDPNNETEIKIEADSMPNELPVDTVWDDIYDSVTPTTPGAGAAASDENQDFINQQSVGETLQDYLLWQMQLTRFSPTDMAIAEAVIAMGKALGLDEAWAKNAIKAVGNYGEIWERNIPALGLPRGINNLWTNGGVMYAPPVR